MAGRTVGPGILKICAWNWRLLKLRTANSNFGRAYRGWGSHSAETTTLAVRSNKSSAQAAIQK